MRWVTIHATEAGMLLRQVFPEQQEPLMQDEKPMLIQKLKEKQAQPLRELHVPARRREPTKPIPLSGPAGKEEIPPVLLQAITGMTMETDRRATRGIIMVMTGLITMTGTEGIKIRTAMKIVGTAMKIVGTAML